MQFKLFFDASALAATATTTKGASYLLLRANMPGPVAVKCCTSEYALRECLRALAKVSTTPAGMIAALKFLGGHLTTGSLEVCIGMPAKPERDKWLAHIEDPDDAPILADAHRMQATAIVAYDHHILKVDPAVIPTSTPESVLQAIDLAVIAASQAAASVPLPPTD